ncbi:spindle and kinetochore-associated protein 1-like [Portunus trituberculatus]|uniref:spindle and kinetochore-associated protein 1-like n=1 Tax=Portunus trituberculatus TaxID=210409 RepID=UPI001E1D1615|nr:spindle and kinetochore-associated protein 1-like [Portunus trituberculatus]XP_045113470.1 spindle and kinetochore-associated protein 1-like [Portunus trituberculatus]
MSSVSEVETFQDLDAHLRNKADVLQVCVTLRVGWGSDTVEEVEQVAKELKTMKQDISGYRSSLSSAREELTTAFALLKKMQELSLRLKHLKEYLPQHMPQPAVQQKSHSMKPPSVESEDQTPTVQPKETPRPTGRKAPKQISKVEFITMVEFESIPKYIRGRLQYAQVNAAVVEINKTLQTKYNLLSRPRAKLSELNMKIVGECQRQENKETKGLHFVVDSDIKRWSSLKMDTAGKSLLTMLRMLKRLREVRGPGNLVRYAVLT